MSGQSPLERLLALGWFNRSIYDYVCGDFSAVPVLAHRSVYRRMQDLHKLASCNRTIFALVCGDRPRFTRRQLQRVRSSRVSGFVYSTALKMRGLDGRDKFYCCLVFLHICLGKLDNGHTIHRTNSAMVFEEMHLLLCLFFPTDAAAQMVELFKTWYEFRCGEPVASTEAGALNRILLCGEPKGPFKAQLITLTEHSAKEARCSAKCLRDPVTGQETLFYKWFSRDDGHFFLNWYVSPYPLWENAEKQQLELLSTSVPIHHLGFFDPQWWRSATMDEVSSLIRIGRKFHQGEPFGDFGGVVEKILKGRRKVLSR
jgi:hypothetical protein